MRARVLLFALFLAPAVSSAQLANRPDSIGLAWAIAEAIRAPIRQNGAPRAAMVTSGTITPESAAWNVRLGGALRGLDSTLLTRRPTKETLRINITTATLLTDSATANVAMSRCFGDRFVGSSVNYVFKRTGTDWKVLQQQKGFAARGPCPKQ
jgi:hypothetical protein